MKTAIFLLGLLSFSAVAAENVIKHPTCIIESLAAVNKHEVQEVLEKKGYTIVYSYRQYAKERSLGTLEVIISTDFSTTKHVNHYKESTLKGKLRDLDYVFSAYKEGHSGLVKIFDTVIVPKAWNPDNQGEKMIYFKKIRRNYSKNLNSYREANYFSQVLDLIPECQIN